MRKDVRDAIVHYSRLIYEKEWVANHEGNLTVRIGNDRYLSTPTSFSKADVAERDLIVVNEKWERQSGIRRPFSEFALHRAIYEARPDVKSVVHAHPPFATAWSTLGRGIPRPLIAEAVVSLGPTIPLVPFSLPGAREGGQLLAEAFEAFDVDNHWSIS